MVKNKLGLVFLFAIGLNYLSFAQEYIGAGSDIGVQVTTSSDLENPPNFDGFSATGQKTISGEGLTYEQMTASRFLAQATMGANLDRIHAINGTDFEAWIDDQFAVPHYSLLESAREVKREADEWFLLNGGDSLEIGFRPNWQEFQYAWWQDNVVNDDLLRQRIAFALSEIFVLSAESDLGGYGDALSSYYDIFLENAFGNYRDILEAVSLHPGMGFYLSHLNNPKANLEENIHPDENYAREIMQLFSIGLYELNQDGSRKKDGSGNDIPTYGQKEIKEFAKVFTGLGIADVGMENEWIDEPYFGLGLYLGELTLPMIMYEEWHQAGEKELLNNFTIPDGQTGMEDIQDALDNIFNHDNVGPFICKQLIQRLVKSNPSPGYISRVSAAFNNNGQGERGDLKAVIKAILLDGEARDCEWLSDETASKLREPIIRYAHFANAVEKEQFYGRFWNVSYGFLEATEQSALSAKSVFNFFKPDFQPIGEITDANLVGPEFQIHNSKTSLGFINQANRWTEYRTLFYSWEREDPDTYINVDELKKLAYDPEVLLNHLDIVFTHGNLTDRTREIIKFALDQIVSRDYREDRVVMALYLIMISPDYAILK
jgi:uncharacterized protein (DUF1800 family)